MNDRAAMIGLLLLHTMSMIDWTTDALSDFVDHV